MHIEFDNYLESLKLYIRTKSSDIRGLDLIDKLIIRANAEAKIPELISQFTNYYTSRFRDYCKLQYWTSLDDQMAIDAVDSAVANCGSFNFSNPDLNS